MENKNDQKILAGFRADNEEVGNKYWLEPHERVSRLVRQK